MVDVLGSFGEQVSRSRKVLSARLLGSSEKRMCPACDPVSSNGVRQGIELAQGVRRLSSIHNRSEHGNFSAEKSAKFFEFGFSDAILQVWAAFLDELVHGREGMRQPFHCATPDEVAWTHRLFTAARRSYAERAVVSVTPSSQRSWGA